MPITKWDCQITKAEEISGALSKTYNNQASKVKVRTDLKDALLKMLKYRFLFVGSIDSQRRECIFNVAIRRISFRNTIEINLKTTKWKKYLQYLFLRKTVSEC